MFDLELALGFASQGFHVFPLYKSNSADRPWIEPKGWNRFHCGLPSDGRIVPDKSEQPASTDAGLITVWAKGPATIGYGLCAPFHIIFDLDIKNGKNGVEQFTKIKALYKIPSPSLIVRTKSGGMHLFYSREKDFLTAKVGKATNLTLNGVEYPGVDFIANSGYVVGPSSIGDNSDWAEGKYLIIKGRPTEPLSVCPVDAYRSQIRSGAESRITGTPTTADELISNQWQGDHDDITDTVKNGKIPARIPAGRRDALITTFIGVLKARRLPRDTVKVLCERFLDNCELNPGETKEKFIASIGLDSKLQRFFAVQGDVNDPRIVARELIEIGKPYRLVNQLHGSMAIIVTAENPYLTHKVIYTEQKARQELTPFTKPIPGSDSKKAVNPYDILIRDGSVPKVHSVGYFPRDVVSYIDPADGLERVNTYEPPNIPASLSKPSDIVQMFTELSEEICGDMSEVFLDFAAHLVQKPWIKMSNALLIISETHGSGKNTLVQALKPLIGARNYMPVAGLAPFMEDKSSILEANVLVVFNEVSRPANRNAWTDMAKAINKIKTAITENSTQINPKYEKQRVITTYSNFIMLSNDPAPFDIPTGDRRIVVINNNPPKLDQGRFKLLADFAHNEKNGQISPREYNDCVFELNEYLSNRQIAVNLTTGDAPTSRAKSELFEALLPPPIRALLEYRRAKGPGATSPITTEDKLIYIIRTVLGFKDFGNRDRNKYDVLDPIVEAGALIRICQKSSRKTRSITGLPNLIDREDFPLLGPVQSRTAPSKVFLWSDVGVIVNHYSDPQLRETAWQDLSELSEKNISGRSDVMKLIK